MAYRKNSEKTEFKDKKRKVLQQGAEAVISLKEINPEEEFNVNGNKYILKKRLRKSYRIPYLDNKIRKLRTRNEAKLLERAGSKVLVPKVFEVDENTKEIKMEFINGKKLSEHLDSFDLKKQKFLAREIGEGIAKIHNLNIAHGDLTTSNIILKKEKESSKENLYFIDFGLAFRSNKWEDRAVDLHLIKQALEAKHFKNWQELFDELIKGYVSSEEDFKEEAEKTLKRLERVEKRGRYKQ